MQEKLVRLPSASSLAEAIRHPGALLSGDRANIQRLAAHLRCSIDDAAEVYRLARRDGYPSAYRSVFEESSGVRRRRRRPRALPPSIDARIARPAGRVRAADSPSG
jgi:hypothetical protein